MRALEEAIRDWVEHLGFTESETKHLVEMSLEFYQDFGAAYDAGDLSLAEEDQLLWDATKAAAYKLFAIDISD
jgi:hypothetical protein